MGKSGTPQPSKKPAEDIVHIDGSGGGGDASKADGTDATTISQEIFDKRTALFMDTFRETCDSEEVPVAIAIVIDPKIQQGPLVYAHGHTYDVAQLLAQVLRQLKAKFAHDLGV